MRSASPPFRTLVLAAGLVACHGSPSPGPEQVCLSTVNSHPPKAPSVATFDEGAITPEELRERLQQMGAAQQRGLTLEQKKGVVRRMAQNQILAYEAVKAGLQGDPEIAEAVRGALVQRLLHKEVEAKVPPPTDGELQAFYDAHQADYARQEMVHVHDLFLAVPRGDKARSAQVRKKAEGLYQKLKAAPAGDFTLFAELAEKDNEDPRSRATKGDLRMLPAKELRASYPPEVVAALDGLKTPGALAPPVQTDAGFYLLKLAQRTDAQSPTFEQLKAQLKTRLLFERRTAAFTRFLEETEQRHHFHVDDSALGLVQPAAPGRPLPLEKPHP